MKKTKVIAETARIIVGVLFVFSGFVKSIDPLGTTYKIGDYLHAFGLDFFSMLAFPLSILLSTIEFLIGLLLLLGIFRKFSSTLALIFLCIMTPLTLYLAIKNPISDCGCFGDAWVISNWATFWKNIVLLGCAILLFLYCKQLTSLIPRNHAFFTLFLCTIYPIGLSVYCTTWGLPLIDFRPYKVGATIPLSSDVDTSSEEPQFETTFIYEKEGIKKEFTIDNYPADDTTWVFIDAITVEKNSSNAQHSEQFVLLNKEGENITDEILTSPDFTFLLISHNLKKANDSKADLINDLYDYSTEHHYKFYGVTASSDTEIEIWKDNTGADYPFLKADEILLKTIIRSNSGLLLIKEGKILYKWSAFQIPGEDFFEKPLQDIPFEVIAHKKNRNQLLIAIALLIVPLGTAMIKKKKKENSNHS
ncbi:MAG: DoxX family protein [Bacteroidales bacterium]|nr:DoxX family protein [Bacteroidales bacterium]